MATFADLERWCSGARMARFKDAADGDEELAVRLYEWNADICAAFMEVVHHVEVLLRNRLHETMAAAFPAAPTPWYLDRLILSTKGVEDAEKAIRRLRAERKTATEGRIIAALSFGFWDALFTKKYEQLWRTTLHQAFTSGPKQRHTVADLTSKIRTFRNRAAHHERLLHIDLQARHNEILTLAGWIDGGAREWIASQSTLPALLQKRPTP